MIRRFRPLTSNDLRTLGVRAAAAAAVWAPRWLPYSVAAATVTPLERDALAGSAEGRWLTLSSGDGVVAAVCIEPQCGRALAEGIAGADALSTAEAAHPVATGLVDRALADFVVTLFRRLPGAPQFATAAGRPPAGALVPGAGDVQVVLEAGEARIVVLIARDGLDGALGAPAASAIEGRKPLEPRASAVRGGRVSLQILLNDTGLSIADVRKLRPRDVVMFEHRITQPLHVRVRPGPEVGACYLGRREQRRAVKLTRNEEELS